MCAPGVYDRVDFSKNTALSQAYLPFKASNCGLWIKLWSLMLRIVTTSGALSDQILPHAEESLFPLQSLQLPHSREPHSSLITSKKSKGSAHLPEKMRLSLYLYIFVLSFPCSWPSITLISLTNKHLQCAVCSTKPWECRAKYEGGSPSSWDISASLSYLHSLTPAHFSVWHHIWLWLLQLKENKHS